VAGELNGNPSEKDGNEAQIQGKDFPRNLEVALLK
jgi:hypothetical protein